MKWVEQKYGSHVAELGHGLDLVVSYERMTPVKEGEPKWNIWVFERRLKVRSHDLQEAKERAEAVAHQWLDEAINSLTNQS